MGFGPPSGWKSHTEHVWPTRADILNLVVGDFLAVLPLRDLVLRPLGERHVLVTYQSEVDGIRANRSSIWERTDSGWLMEFHQGTTTTAESS